MVCHLAIVHAMPVQSPVTEILRMPCKTGMLLQQGDERRDLLEDVLCNIVTSGTWIRDVTRFIQLLGNVQRLFRSQSEFGVGTSLQGGQVI